MFPMTITINNENQLSAVMAAMFPTPPVADAPVIAHAKAEEKKAAPITADKAAVKIAERDEAITKAIEEKRTTETEATPAASAKERIAENKTTEATTFTYQDAATAVTKLHKTKGRDVAVAMLATFGAATLKDVKPEQFADVIAAAEKALVE